MEMRRTVQRMRQRGRKGRDKKGILSGCTHAHTFMSLTDETTGEEREREKLEQSGRTLRWGRRRHKVDKRKDKKLPEEAVKELPARCTQD